MRTQRLRSTSPLGVAFLAAALLLAFAPPAQALTLDQAKASGALGERYDGYLGVVNASAEADALAKNVNAKRKAAYAQIASKQGTTTAAVAAITGAKLVGEAPSGQYVLSAPDAGWKKVP